MNFKLKLYSAYSDGLPPEGELVMADETDEVTYVGTVRDYSIAAEIVHRWNTYRETITGPHIKYDREKLQT